MSQMNTDKVLKNYRAALDERFLRRIERVILFGSRARGDHTSESDYDVAVFLRAPYDLWEDSRPLAEIQLKFLREVGVLINAVPLPEGSDSERTPFMANVRREGVAI